MTKVTNRPNHSILYCIYFENKYVNVLEMNTHIFICYENERIEFMKIELSKIWIMYTIFNFYDPSYIVVGKNKVDALSEERMLQSNIYFFDIEKSSIVVYSIICSNKRIHR